MHAVNILLLDVFLTLLRAFPQEGLGTGLDLSSLNYPKTCGGQLPPKGLYWDLSFNTFVSVAKGTGKFVIMCVCLHVPMLTAIVIHLIRTACLGLWEFWVVNSLNLEYLMKHFPQNLEQKYQLLLKSSNLIQPRVTSQPLLKFSQICAIWHKNLGPLIPGCFHTKPLSKEKMSSFTLHTLIVYLQTLW